MGIFSDRAAWLFFFRNVFSITVMVRYRIALTRVRTEIGWEREEKDKSEKGGNGGTGFVWH